MTRAAFLVDGLRSPFGRYGGGLAVCAADDLAGQVIAALVARTGIPADRIDDVLLGCANQAGEDNRNVARMSALLAGLPVSVPGVTVNRLCGSGMQAIADAARLIATGEADLVIAGGVEQMTRAPLVMGKPTEAFARGHQTIYDTTLGWRFVNPRMEAMHGTLAMGETAERVAERCGVSREAQDRFAHLSQQRAGRAIASGRIARELTPIVTGTDKKTGAELRVTADEHPRPETTLEQLAKLRPRSPPGHDRHGHRRQRLRPQRRGRRRAGRQRAGDRELGLTARRASSPAPRPASSRATWASGRSRPRRRRSREPGSRRNASILLS